MSGPSEHLGWHELACGDGTPYPEEWREVRAVILAREFEAVRMMAGGHPIFIGSGYRTEAWNRSVGGAKSSQHVQGRAIDLHPLAYTPEKLLRVVLERARMPDSSIRGVGEYPWGIHVDIRNSVRLVRWNGSRAWSEVL